MIETKTLAGRTVRLRDVFILGFAFFATYFGAGNLIFPPQLGLSSGTAFLPALLGLSLSGILLPVFALLVINRCGDVRRLTAHVGKHTYHILLTLLMIICTFVSIPRTCATAVQLGVQGNFPDLPFTAGVLIYFAVAYFFTFDEGSVFDKMGKYLTPILALILIVVGAAGIFFPLGTPADPVVENAFVNAFLGGYNTGDVLVSFIMASLFIGAVEAKGYTTRKSRNEAMVLCGLITVILLLVIYGSLLYMGACVSGDYEQSIGRAALLVAIIQRVGGWVMIPMGIAVVLACLTTAVGQIAAVANFFSALSAGRVSYRFFVIVTAAVSAATALLGVDGIVTYIGWIYSISYPPVLALMVLGTFAKVIPNDGAYRGATYLVVIYALLEALPGLSGMAAAKAIVAVAPLSSYGFGWITPFLIGFVGGAVWGHVRRETAIGPENEKAIS